MDVDVVTVGDNDGETDVVVETEEVCDGDGPLGDVLALAVEVAVADKELDVEDDSENEVLFVTDKVGDHDAVDV